MSLSHFWAAYDATLDLVRSERPTTFAHLKAILDNFSPRGEGEAFFPGGADVLQTGFANAPRAKLYGGEVELQKYIPLDGLDIGFLATRRLVAIANYTFTKSSIDATDQLIASPLQTGMSAFVRNIIGGLMR